MQLDVDDVIYGCGYLPMDVHPSIGQRQSLAIHWKPDDKSAMAIERVEHPATERAAAIAPAEAAHMEAELWATGVEARIARQIRSQDLLLLTFGRHTQELEDALLASPLSRSVGRTADVKPLWASGAKIFVALEQDELQVSLPQGCVLRPWHVVIHEKDEDDLFTAIAHLPELTRRLKPVYGRRVLHCSDNYSTREIQNMS